MLSRQGPQVKNYVLVDISKIQVYGEDQTNMV